jgi:long-chain acyl-CoA synthetase
MKFPTLMQDYFIITAKSKPKKTALIFNDERYTYEDINTRTDILAINLLDLGLKKQERVAIFLNNSPEIIFSLYATLKAGGVFVIINGAVQPGKLHYILKDSGARIIITHSAKLEIVNKAAGSDELQCNIILVDDQPDIHKSLKNQLHYLSSLMEKYKTLSDTCGHLEKIAHRCIDQDMATLIYTSGSTGDPKGVISSHRNMISAAQSIVEYLENTEDDIILNTLALSFDYGLYQVIMAFMFGGTVVLEKSFLFVSQILSLIHKEKVTGFPIVPAIVAMIFKYTNLDKYDLSSLRYMTNTGAAFPVEHILKLRELLPHVRIYSMFGLTECKRIAYLHPDEIDKRPSSVGKAMPNCEVFVINENGELTSPGESGELVVRGSNVMKGYWNSPELTDKVFRTGLGYSDKLLFTGDYFKTDDEGYLYFIGRKDDMLKPRGERISAKEVENIIYKMDGVLECAVIGVPDELFGQAIKAFIVKGLDSDLNKEDILKFCAQNLESFFIPKYIEFIDEMPKNPHGKIDKLALSNRK